MNKILSKIIFIIVIFAITSCVYADEVMMINTLPKPQYTFEDGRNELDCITYNLVMNGTPTRKIINIHQYVDNDEYVDLREFVESLGGRMTKEMYSFSGYNIGYFELLGSRYKYVSHFSKNTLKDLETDSKVKNYAAINYPINFFKYDKNCHNYIHIPTNISENMRGKLVNNRIYVQMDRMIYILYRIGYLYNFDDETKTFNVKKYDFNAEKELMYKKFPVGKFGYGLYKEANGKDFENIVYHPSVDIETGKYMEEPFFNDVFDNMINNGKYMETNYIKYFDANYQSMHVVHKDADTFYKNLLEATYGYYYDDAIVKYDNDLDAYIVSNKDFSGVDELDKTYRILVVRKFDNMPLYMTLF